MEHSQDFRGADYSTHSKHTNKHEDATYKHDLEHQSCHGNDYSDTATHEKAPKDPNVVDWDGPDDPANPMNWTSAKKVAAIAIVSLITFLS